MNATTIHEAESVTRSIARWGSAVAATIFGVAFVTDKTLSWALFSGQSVQIGLVVAIFMGYGLAWSKRFEVLGSAIAIISIIGVYAYHVVTGSFLPNPIFVAVGAPAAFHLVAVALHRCVRTHANG